MNRAFSLVWNRALGALQVASELAGTTRGAGASSAASSFPRRLRLVAACAAALSAVAFALPAWSATTCPAGAVQWSSATGAAGSNASTDMGNGGAGLAAQLGVAGSSDCLPTGAALTGGAGGAGGNRSGFGGAGGDGGYGVGGSDFTLTNNGTITGGVGGANYAFFAASQGGDGIHGTGFTLTNQGMIVGGVGFGGAPFSYSTAAGGGVGGSDFTLTNAATITGGAGGNGANSGNVGMGFGGGYGVGGSGFTLTNAATITGGAGGDGGATINGGSAGAGGAGVTGAGFTLTNTATITGGNGGNSVAASGAPGDSFVGGAGGNGVSGTDFTLTNRGTITGGHGGNGILGGYSYFGFLGGVSGAGVYASGGARVTTSGRIAAGEAGSADGGTGSAPFDAVEFSGGANTLTLESGYSFTGNVVSTSGTSNGGDTLGLGGTTNGTFSTSMLDVGAAAAWTGTPQFAGFQNFQKTGTGTWKLTGSTLAATPWNVLGGTLEVGNTGALGAGTITVDDSADEGATLEVDTGVTVANPIVLNHGATLANAGALDAGTSSAYAVGSAAGPATVNNSGAGSITGHYEAVWLADGGTVSNAGLGSSIAGIGGGTASSGGVIVKGAPGTVNNAAGASITGYSVGVWLDKGGTVNNTGIGSSILATNTASTLEPALGVQINDGGTLNNSGGAYVGGAQEGAYLVAGGTLNNTGGAQIASAGWGVALAGGGQVNNQGGASITGGEVGIWLANGGTVVNGDGSLIQRTGVGGYGCGTSSDCAVFAVAGGGPTTFDNAGSVIGDVVLDPGAANVVELTAGGLIAGNLAVGSDAGSTLTLDGSSTTPQLYSQAVTGTTTFAGSITKAGSGTWVVDNNDLAGAFAVAIGDGTLVVGDTAHPTTTVGGNVTVDSGATLAGLGTIAGDVDAKSSSTVAPGDPDPAMGTLTINGDFTAEQGSTLAYTLGAPGAASTSPGTGDHIKVGGNLTLNGATLDITDAGNMGPGFYDLIDYAGTQTDANGGISVGSVKSSQGLSASNFSVEGLASSATKGGVVTLVEQASAPTPRTCATDPSLCTTTTTPPPPPSPLTVWNANGLAAAGVMGGGSGTWSATGATWTDVAGTAPNGSAEPDGFLVFGGAPGIVTVDDTAGNVAASGMQFYSSGYSLQGNVVTLTGSTSATPIVRVGDGTTASKGYVATIDAPLAGNAGFDKTDYGTLVVNGARNTVTGPVTVSDGALVVGDTAHSNAVLANAVDVANGATLGGIGKVASIDDAGTLSLATPGNGLHVTGNVSFAKGSTLAVAADPDGKAGHLRVDGSVAIQGGSVAVQAGAGAWAPATTYTIVSAGKGVTGVFSGVSTDLAFLTPTLAYTTDAVNLGLFRNDVDFATFGTSPDTRGVATAIQNLGLGNPVYNAVLVQSGPEAASSLQRLDGEYLVSQATARNSDARYVREAMNKGLRAGGHEVERIGNTRLMGWANVWGHWTRWSGASNGTQRTSDNGDGLLIGAQLPFADGHGQAGVALGGSRDTFSTGSATSWGGAKSTWIGGFAGYAMGPVDLRAGVAYSWDHVPDQRDVAIPGLHEHIGADLHGHTTTEFVEASHTFTVGDGLLTPFANVAQTSVSTQDALESGGAAALRIGQPDFNATSSTLGARMKWKIASHVDLDAKLGWQHAYGTLAPHGTLQFVAGGSTFADDGVPLARNAGVGRIALGWHTGPVAIDAGYSLLAGAGLRDNTANVSVAVSF